jgi:hypothetical protein
MTWRCQFTHWPPAANPTHAKPYPDPSSHFPTPLTHSTFTLRSGLRPHHSGPLGCRNVSTRVPPARLHVSDKCSRECCRTGEQEGGAIGLG